MNRYTPARTATRCAQVLTSAQAAALYRLIAATAWTWLCLAARTAYQLGRTTRAQLNRLEGCGKAPHQLAWAGAVVLYRHIDREIRQGRDSHRTVRELFAAI